MTHQLTIPPEMTWTLLHEFKAYLEREGYDPAEWLPKMVDAFRPEWRRACDMCERRLEVAKMRQYDGMRAVVWREAIKVYDSKGEGA